MSRILVTSFVIGLALFGGALAEPSSGVGGLGNFHSSFPLISSVSDTLLHSGPSQFLSTEAKKLMPLQNPFSSLFSQTAQPYQSNAASSQRISDTGDAINIGALGVPHTNLPAIQSGLAAISQPLTQTLSNLATPFNQLAAPYTGQAVQTPASANNSQNYYSGYRESEGHNRRGSVDEGFMRRLSVPESSPQRVAHPHSPSLPFTCPPGSHGSCTHYHVFIVNDFSGNGYSATLWDPNHHPKGPHSHVKVAFDDFGTYYLTIEYDSHSGGNRHGHHSQRVTIHYRGIHYHANIWYI